MKAFIVLVVAILIFLYIPNVEFSKQLLLLDSLKQISSIILAITGAWAAIVYPESLKKLINKIEDTESNIKSIKKLVKPMFISIVILIFIVIIEIIGFTLKLYLNHFAEYIDYLRKSSLTIIILLYLLQIYSLLSTLIPILDAYRVASNEHEKNKIIEAITSSTIKKKKRKKKE